MRGLGRPETGSGIAVKARRSVTFHSMSVMPACEDFFFTDMN